MQMILYTYNTLFYLLLYYKINLIDCYLLFRRIYLKLHSKFLCIVLELSENLSSNINLDIVISMI